MRASFRKSHFAALFAFVSLCFAIPQIYGQAAGNSGSIAGTVTDPTGAVVPNATVEIRNLVSQYDRITTTDSKGIFRFSNVPFNPYHVTVNATGFAGAMRDVDIRSVVPTNVSVSLQVIGSRETVTVEANAGDLLENDPTFHTDVDRNLFSKLPLESTTSGLSSLVTLATPGIAADSNGLFHGIGDHASNSFSIDGQPITDQQSKVFSNQLPVDSVQSMEVISGAPPAEYGGKTSVVIVATTRSGQGVTTPHGGVSASYGSFGTSTVEANLAYGGKTWGNFISLGGMNTGRFLDPPEFAVFHDKGNEENVFDRVDYQFSSVDSIHLDLGYSRSWFQTPNNLDSENATPWSGLFGLEPQMVLGGVGPNGEVVGPDDQRSKIGTFNIAPSWTHVLNTNTVYTLGAFVRRDDYNYYPSGDPFSDLGPPSLQRQSVSQNRSLTNAGLRTDLSYVKGIHQIKGGVTYEQTFLNEYDTIGIVDPTFNAPCITDVYGTSSVNPYPWVAVPGLTAADCSGLTGPLQANTAANPNAPGDAVPPAGAGSAGYPSALYPFYNPLLAPYDLSRGGIPYAFNGHTDVKELALYVRDNITKGSWSLNLGLRGDLYNGITTGRQAEPRLGIAYNIRQTNTILRVSYARTLESPFNENLVLSSTGCANPVLAPMLICTAPVPNPLSVGFRNEFHAGLEQAFGKYLVFSGEWISKYTHNGFDFSVLGNTPITYPIEWHNSKIPGWAGRISVPEVHGFSALVVFSSVAARFFLPQVAGAGATIGGPPGTAFRIDHDEKFNQTAHFQYQPWKRGPWMGFNWRYDSGLVAGATPCFGLSASNDCPQSIVIGGVPNVSMMASNVLFVPLSADQEAEAGFTCNGVRATPTVPLPYNCPASAFGSPLVDVPRPGAEQDDHNPPRIAHRNLFDMSVGDDNLFHGDRYKWSLQLTAINLANKFGLYNFLSTFSGTHYVTPRALTAELGFHF
jgi:Carboxypeptidase regulatory-like domain